MQKDVIYIDTEDDITAIIGKVKATSHKIVALVPPKRIGAIQSAVNLKLVHRAAEQADKRLVIISNNAALTALAGSTGIPVAKNLQSKPELAEIPALEVDDGDDVIDGSDPQTAVGKDAALAAVEGDETAAAASSVPVARATSKSKSKIPDFNKFRKKLFIGAAAAVLLIAGLVWAIVFAPSAKVIITARTSDVALNTQVKLGTGLATSLKEGTVRSELKTVKKEISIPFTATGEKNAGDKATGTVKFSNSNLSSVTVAAGTRLTSGDLEFTLSSGVTIPAAGCNGSILNCSPGTASGTVAAAEAGTSYNSASGALSGASTGVSASFVGSTSGGTDKMVKVVQQSDVDAVQDQVLTSTDSDTARQALIKQLGSDYIVLDSSFKADKSAVTPSPAVGAEAADGRGTLTGNVTFSIVAVKKAELSTLLKEYLNQSLDGKTDQKVYADGVNTVSFTNVNAVDGGFTANITANGKVGPKIDEDALKTEIKGKRFGEIQSYAQSINGVESVDVKFSPFWVNSAPNDVKRISVEFKVNG